MRGLERSSRARHLLGVRCSDSHLRSSSAWTQERVGLRKPALPRPGCTRPRGSLQCSRLAGRCATGASRPRAACGAGVRPLTLVLRHARCPLHFAPLLGAPQGTPDSCDPASCLAFEASFLFEVLGQDRERSVGSGASSALRARRDHVEPSLLGCPPRKASGASSALRARRDHVEPSLLGCLPRKASGASSALRACGFASVPHPQVLPHELLRNPGRKPRAHHGERTRPGKAHPATRQVRAPRSPGPARRLRPRPCGRYAGRRSPASWCTGSRGS